ncbi:MAG: transporter substrate-binding domain-containing protein [Pseudomonadota bacterium]
MLKLFIAGCLALCLAGPASADALQDILDRGTVKLGVRGSAPPFAFLDETGAPAGLAVRLCNAVVGLIAKHHGTKLGIDYSVLDAKQRFPALINRETDLHCGPASATLKRREILDFSIIYFVDGAAAAVRPDGDFSTIFETEDGTFGALGGTTTMGVVEDLVKRNNLDVELKGFDSHGAGLSELAAGEIDVYFGDQAILFFQIEALDLIGKVNVVEDIFSFEPYALVMKRGEDDLRLAVDRALSQIYESGLIYQMILQDLKDYPLSTEAKTLYLVVGLPE